ncbi:MAG: M56 family metallopeptidase, partial [Duncaniella sp.]|nr:M56 family metallopeptidase [Duncaniella sp.]
DEGIAPFSVMRVIVMSRCDYDEAGEMIFEHERNHVRLYHWADLLMAQAVAALQWYNPAAWLMREELKAVHEYQADAGVMRSGLNIKQYQMLLIKKAVGARFPSLANSLNHSKLKKRITMMYNSRTSTTRRLRALVLVPALGGALLVTNLPAVAEVFDSVADTDLLIGEDKISENRGDEQMSLVEVTAYVPSADKAVDAVTADPESPQKEVVVHKKTSPSEPEKATTTAGDLGEIVVVGYAGDAQQKPVKESDEVRGSVSDEDKRVYDEVETPPSFPGGVNELMKLIAGSIRYPADAYREGVQGRVVMQFVVGKDGKVTSPTVVRGVCESIDEEAKRVVMQLPDFIPGKMNGEPVAVRYRLPLVFKLSPGKKDGSRCSGSNAVNVKDAIASGVTVLVDGKKVDTVENIDPKSIQSVDVIKTDPQYPKGLIKITLKDGTTVETNAE